MSSPFLGDPELSSCPLALISTGVASPGSDGGTLGFGQLWVFLEKYQLKG